MEFDVERHVHWTVDVMVLSAIAHASRSRLVIYLRKIMEPYFLRYFNRLNNSIFQQDETQP